MPRRGWSTPPGTRSETWARSARTIRGAAVSGRWGHGACLLFPQGAIYNEQYIQIGEGTMVGPYACLSAGMAPGQEMPTDPVVRIGSRCVIGRGSHIVGHWSIEIGDDIQTGPYVYITDQNHTYEDPVEPIGRQWPTEAAVRIGSGSWLGANVDHPARGPDRGARGRGRGRRGARHLSRSLRDSRCPGQDHPPMGRGTGLGRREGGHRALRAHTQGGWSRRTGASTVRSACRPNSPIW